MIIDTHVHVFTDDRKNYPQIRDTPRAGSIPSVTEIGQTEWPLTTTELLISMMDEAGVDKATLVQAYFFYEKLVSVFGAKRIMWSSNYPAHPKFGGIKPRLEASKKALAFLSQDDQAWILGKTAFEFYPCLKSK
jgi:predicted TIM-barrel fold metal-dependent hydrolase